jgi:hypothetical protein
MLPKWGTAIICREFPDTHLRHLIGALRETRGMIAELCAETGATDKQYQPGGYRYGAELLRVTGRSGMRGAQTPTRHRRYAEQRL